MIKPEEILEWNKRTFPYNPELQIKKVEEELLELEEAKRLQFTSQCLNFENIFEEAADVIIACIGLTRYPEYKAISRAIQCYVMTSSMRSILNKYIERKMAINKKRKFNNKTFHHEETKSEEVPSNIPQE